MKLVKIFLSIFILTVLVSACTPKDDVIELPEGIGAVDTERGKGAQAKETDYVEVHYTGYLAESMMKFDSSVDRGRPFTFQIGSGQVIPGWELGIQGMRVGGKRTLTIEPEHAYGERGAGDVIPGNATLVFDVELLSITPQPTIWEYTDDELTTTESGLQYKIKTEGEGEPIKDGDVVSMFYAGFFEDGSIFDTSMNNPAGFRYQLGTGRAIAGFEEGVVGMKKGEERLLILSPDLAYGDEGVGDIIPPNATLYFTVRIEDIQ